MIITTTENDRSLHLWRPSNRWRISTPSLGNNDLLTSPCDQLQSFLMRLKRLADRLREGLRHEMVGRSELREEIGLRISEPTPHFLRVVQHTADVTVCWRPRKLHRWQVFGSSTSRQKKTRQTLACLAASC